MIILNFKKYEYNLSIIEYPLINKLRIEMIKLIKVKWVSFYHVKSIEFCAKKQRKFALTKH